MSFKTWPVTQGASSKDKPGNKVSDKLKAALAVDQPAVSSVQLPPVRKS